ncbi:hypothetical protein D1872_229220 [compost metagenome]
MLSSREDPAGTELSAEVGKDRDDVPKFKIILLSTVDLASKPSWSADRISLVVGASLVLIETTMATGLESASLRAA